MGLVPWLVVLERRSRSEALALSGLWSLAYWIVLWEWGPAAVARYFDQSVGVGVAFLLATWSLLLLPFVLAFAWLHRRLARRFDRALPLLSAAAWAATDLARVRLFTGTDLLIGNPWGVLGYSQVDWTTGLQIVSVTGIYGLGFVLVAANVALARIAIAGWEGRLDARRGLAWVAAGAAPLALAAGWGAASLANDQTASTAGVRVAIVQGNLAGGARWRSDLYGRNLDTYLRLTQEAMREHEVEIVFWPEAAMTFFVEEERGYRGSIGVALGEAELVAGSPRRAGRPPRHYNSVFRLGPGGELAGVYDKQLLLPFAEFSPLGHLDLVRREFGAIREFAVGENASPIPTRAGAAGILVCNEVLFPSLAHRQVAEGARYLVNPANDGWVGDVRYSEQMFQIARVRAVEEGRWLVRPSTSGPSALVDPRGRVRGRLEPSARDVLVGEIEPREARTFYSRWGDAFAGACGLAVPMALLGLRRSRVP